MVEVPHLLRLAIFGNCHNYQLFIAHCTVFTISLAKRTTQSRVF